LLYIIKHRLIDRSFFYFPKAFTLTNIWRVVTTEHYNFQICLLSCICWPFPCTCYYARETFKIGGSESLCNQP